QGGDDAVQGGRRLRAGVIGQVAGEQCVDGRLGGLRLGQGGADQGRGAFGTRVRHVRDLSGHADGVARGRGGDDQAAAVGACRGTDQAEQRISLRGGGGVDRIDQGVT